MNNEALAGMEAAAKLYGQRVCFHPAINDDALNNGVCPVDNTYFHSVRWLWNFTLRFTSRKHKIFLILPIAFY